MTQFEIYSILYFLILWWLFAISVNSSHIIKKVSLSAAMDKRRREWFLNTASRELRMIDTNIMSGLQNGVAFFASTCILAIGGCFAALGSAEQVLSVIQDIPLSDRDDRVAFEAKLTGLICILGFAFFKFGWSYRLFNYSSVLLGAIPMINRDHLAEDIERAAQRTAAMNILAGNHFNSGLRTIFLALAYLGIFVSPWALITTTSLIMVVLIRRQYFSRARRVALGLD